MKIITTTNNLFNKYRIIKKEQRNIKLQNSTTITVDDYYIIGEKPTKMYSYNEIDLNILFPIRERL